MNDARVGVARTEPGGCVALFGSVSTPASNAWVVRKEGRVGRYRIRHAGTNGGGQW